MAFSYLKNYLIYSHIYEEFIYINISIKLLLVNYKIINI